MGKSKKTSNVAVALTLMVLAPLVAEVLPGATRFSSLFVLPIEMLVWGGGTMLIRYAVRRWKLGWINMILLALALSIAEEFLIQQTSLAPMVVKIKGVTYARAFGVNYVYLIWALIYETVYVVLLPVHLTELIYPEKRDELWIGKRGIIAVVGLFFAGSFLAWYSWTQIARPNVFHVAAYNPPFFMVVIALATIGSLLFIALGPFKNKLSVERRPKYHFSKWILFVFGNLWAVVLYAICLLAFGISPEFSPSIPVITAVLLAIIPIAVVPAFAFDFRRSRTDPMALIFGVVSGSMLAGFIGFIGAAPIDLYFKILANIITYILFIRFWVKTGKEKIPEMGMV